MPENFSVPKEIAPLIPDAVTSGHPSPEAKQAVKEIEESFENRADNIVKAARSLPQAKRAINGIFKHPSDFTDEEWDIIVEGLKSHLPLNFIAKKVNCERHFLSKKIRENEDVIQVLLDSREGVLDEMEYQLIKTAREGSVSAIIYYLDHQGRSRGYGDQEQSKEQVDDVQIVFGEIPSKDIEEGKNIIAEAEKKTTPTLAAELAAMEIPEPANAHDLAIAEDAAKALAKTTEHKPVEVSSAIASPPPYANQGMSDERYDFLEAAFADGGDSPFGSFN